jgi:predicted Zn-dependent protease
MDVVVLNCWVTAAKLTAFRSKLSMIRAKSRRDRLSRSTYPAQTLSETELYRISVHEIGHVLGLQHSFNARSVMYGFNLEGPEWLDPTDLAELARHHALRIATLDKPVELTQGR